MITNPHAQRILCFGDSNTWGQQPGSKERFDVDVRWTGLLQVTLGDQYQVVEEGLSSRTTDLDFSRKPGRNGKLYFRPCVESHNPLDLIVIMLGTNDAKVEFGPRQPGPISAALQNEFVYKAREIAKNRQGQMPKIAIVSPIAIYPQAPRFTDAYAGIYDERSARVIANLASTLKAMAHANDCLFADAATIARPGEDGIHMDAAGHKALATFLALKIQTEWLV